MRLRPVVSLALATSTLTALTACDQTTAPVVASLGGGLGGGFTFIGSSAFFFVSPRLVTLVTGQSVQLVANLGDAPLTEIQWRSLQPRVAQVNRDGIVTALAPGRATIVARLAADTNRVAPATIIVRGAFVPVIPLIP